jgi:hypothetical protein
MSRNALGAAISTLDPQALDLSDGYYHAQIAVGHEARDSNIALVAKELPYVLADQVGGPAQQFDILFHKEGGFRWITLRRKALPGTRVEPGRWTLDDYLDREVFALVEQLVKPRYQGAVYGKMEALKTPSGHIAVKLVRQCGRWRIAFPDIEARFGSTVTSLSMGSNTLRFLIDGDTSNEGILEIMRQVAAHLQLYFPPYIYVEDSTEQLADSMLEGLFSRGGCRFWIDFYAKQAAEAK